MADRAGQQFRDITRREFLNYVWIASLALFMAGTGGAVYAFALPRFLGGEFGGKATIGKVAEQLPPPDDRPAAHPDIKTWIVNIGPKGADRVAVIKAFWPCTKYVSIWAAYTPGLIQLIGLGVPVTDPNIN